MYWPRQVNQRIGESQNKSELSNILFGFSKNKRPVTCGVVFKYVFYVQMIELQTLLHVRWRLKIK